MPSQRDCPFRSQARLGLEEIICVQETEQGMCNESGPMLVSARCSEVPELC